MNENENHQGIEKLFDWSILWLFLVGLAINFILAHLATHFKLPLYIDNVGSVLVAALGGAIPGMSVGFLSNIINAHTDPFTMYYGILTVFNALVAAEFSKRGYLKKLSGCIVLALVMVVIGGAGGSVMTWMLYGGEIGGIAAPLAFKLNALGIPAFSSQLMADVAADIPDKLLTIVPVYLFLHFYPKRLYDKFPYSFLYDRSVEEREKTNNEKPHYVKHSVNDRITGIIVVSASLISLCTIIIGIGYYQSDLREKYVKQVQDISALVTKDIDGNKIQQYLKNGENDTEYRKIKERLQKTKDIVSEIKYIYVYTQGEDGWHCVFDLDTEEVPAYTIGELVPVDKSFSDNYDKNKTIIPIVTHDEFGWLLTGGTEIKNTAGVTTAIAFVDIAMEEYIHDMLVYIIKMIALLFGLTLCICSFALWYATKQFTSPLNSIVRQTRAFDEITPEHWLNSQQWINRNPVTTGDEIEELYRTVSNVQENISENVVKLKEAEHKIRKAYELEKKNKELSTAIQKADRESALKTDFYSRMSHDMRTPMNGIIGLVNLSQDEKDIAVIRENINKIGISSQYLLALINDTLDMSKIETKKLKLELKPSSMKNLIESISDMLRPSIESKGIIFNGQYDIDKEQYLLMDQVRVKQIFMNLLSNSIKFTPKNGRIFLKITNTVENEGVNSYTAVIADSGCGMSKDFIENKIFMPFSQEHNNITMSSAGSGLGLAIVKNLVEIMGGSVSVESELGKGTTFTIKLPMKIAKAPQKIEEKKKTDTAILNGKKILVCEDHPLNREIITKLLTRVGIIVDMAENGEIGYKKFKESIDGEYSAVLMDVRMPVMDGLQTARAIRGLSTPYAMAVPIIAMTANAYEEDKRMTMEAGMNEHLAKPIDMRLLYETLVHSMGK